jgi:hypothetical protein
LIEEIIKPKKLGEGMIVKIVTVNWSLQRPDPLSFRKICVADNMV